MIEIVVMLLIARYNVNLKLLNPQSGEINLWCIAAAKPFTIFKFNIFQHLNNTCIDICQKRLWCRLAFGLITQINFGLSLVTLKIHKNCLRIVLKLFQPHYVQVC